MSNPPTYERFAHNWGNGTSTKVAIGADYDEQLTARFKSLDWSDTHATWEPDYQFMDDRDDGAWTVDADALADARDRTNLSIPRPSEIPINPRPFADGSSSIEIVERNSADLRRECHRCGADGMLSAFEYERVYKSATGLVTELLLDEDTEATHVCTSCKLLLTVEMDDRSEMARAMGEPA